MRKYVAQRLLQIPVVLFFISVIVFSLMHIAPGDPVDLMLGDYFTAEDAAKLRRNLGLDRPLYVQYLSWVWGATHLDFGNSFHTLQPISEMILERAPYTIFLASLSVAFALLPGAARPEFEPRCPVERRPVKRRHVTRPLRVGRQPDRMPRSWRRLTQRVFVGAGPSARRGNASLVGSVPRTGAILKQHLGRQFLV